MGIIIRGVIVRFGLFSMVLFMFIVLGNINRVFFVVFWILV